MKIRAGFVSNSSSSSFVIFGKIMGKDELMRVFKFTEDEMRDIEENGLWDYEDKNLKGLNHVSIDYGVEPEYVIGKSLKGSGAKILEQIFDAELVLGSGCILYRGVDQDGNICLDD
jgi:hypothetical protein